MLHEFANVNELWSRVIAETLRAKGVRFAVICPGSRSSPLAFAFDRTEGIESIPILDERSASFFALGIAKREGMPVVLVCTSGTAAANFYPAVIEASESGVPLVVITADRPHELRGCRAGQTIAQVGIYASYPVSQVELEIPVAEQKALISLKETIEAQVDCSMGVPFGPVHVNAPFRDPLAPVPDGVFASPLSTDELKGFCEPSSNRKVSITELDIREFAQTQRGLILVGSYLRPTSEDWLTNVARLADQLKWPVLSDGLSSLRNHVSLFPRLITGFNAICRIVEEDSELLPERILVIGDLPISKTLRTWLSIRNIKSLFLTPLPGEFDPNRGDSESLYFDFNQGVPIVPCHDEPEFAAKWKRIDALVSEEIENRLSRFDFVFEGSVSAILSHSLPSGSSFFVSNSMPPRDMEFFWNSNDRGMEIYSSRGANGIDGILSTALGVAHRGKPTYLLTGDLALLHDSNGGLISKKLEGSLTIILVNNAGGGIFEMLPVSQLGEEFETYFATDQQIDFSKWAATYDIEYVKANSLKELETCLGRETRKGVNLIEVVTDRKRDAAERKRIFREIASCLSFR